MSDDLSYQFVNVPGASDSEIAHGDAMTQRASQTGDQFTSKINDNVKEQSNLMGDQTSDDPMTSALKSRASNAYGSAINSMMRQAKVAGTDMQNQVQTQNVSQQAAHFANMQSRAQLNYQQISFQRSAAIDLENAKRELYGHLFGGIGAVAGAGVAIAGKAIAAQKQSSEADLNGTNATGGTNVPDFFK